MERREAVKLVTLLVGGSLTGAQAFITGCKPADSQVNRIFKKSQVDLLSEIAETILPATKTPGAKDAKVGDFIALMVNDCYETKDQQTFLDGLAAFEKDCKATYGKTFLRCTPEQRLEFVTRIDKEAKGYMDQKKVDEPAHYFRNIKDLTLLGYFTSEPGATQAIRYVPVPGKYEACIPYQKGDRIFAR